MTEQPDQFTFFGDVPPPRDTLAEARAQVLEMRFSKTGMTCPCCDQLAKVYYRPIYAPMLRALIAMARAGDAGMAGAQFKPLGGGDYGKLEFWGVAYQDPGDGRWRCTTRGYDFLFGHARIPQRVYIYDDNLIDISEKDQDIRELTASYRGKNANTFDLDDIMDPANYRPRTQ